MWYILTVFMHFHIAAFRSRTQNGCQYLCACAYRQEYVIKRTKESREGKKTENKILPNMYIVYIHHNSQQMFGLELFLVALLYVHGSPFVGLFVTFLSFSLSLSSFSSFFSIYIRFSPFQFVNSTFIFKPVAHTHTHMHTPRMIRWCWCIQWSAFLSTNWLRTNFFSSV